MPRPVSQLSQAQQHVLFMGEVKLNGRARVDLMCVHFLPDRQQDILLASALVRDLCGTALKCSPERGASQAA